MTSIVLNVIPRDDTEGHFITAVSPKRLKNPQLEVPLLPTCEEHSTKDAFRRVINWYRHTKEQVSTWKEIKYLHQAWSCKETPHTYLLSNGVPAGTNVLLRIDYYCLFKQNYNSSNDSSQEESEQMSNSQYSDYGDSCCSDDDHSEEADDDDDDDDDTDNDQYDENEEQISLNDQSMSQTTIYDNVSEEDIIVTIPK